MFYKGPGIFGRQSGKFLCVYSGRVPNLCGHNPTRAVFPHVQYVGRAQNVASGKI